MDAPNAPHPPIFDAHNDTLLKLHQDPDIDFFEWNARTHVSYPRAIEGGLAGGFFAIFTPSEEGRRKQGGSAEARAKAESEHEVNSNYARRHTLSLLADLSRLEQRSDGRMQIVYDAAGLEHCLENDIFAAVAHIEGAEALGDKPEALEGFYQAGVRSLGFVWSRPNAFGTGVPFRFPSSPDIGPGLSDAGKELVKVCNQMGVMIDLSHMNEKGFWDVAKLSEKPLVATHSNVHALAATPRNLTDKQLSAIRESGGMVGLNFAVGFLREDGEQDPDTPLSVMVQHVDYLVDELGEDHVGFGSDFDGATMPYGVRDVSGLPNLMDALSRHGYDEALLRKLAHANWLELLKKTWK